MAMGMRLLHLDRPAALGLQVPRAHIGDTPYPLNFHGMIESYVAGLPFLRNTMIGDLLYTGLLFGGFALLERRFDGLREHPAAQPA